MTASVVAAKRAISKQDFYRYCRLVHGWLSAFAFVILCFFAITGMLLNHPEWGSSKAPAVSEHTFKLDEQELRHLVDAIEPESVLHDIAARHVALKGAFSAGNQVGNEIFVRLQGVRGLTDLRASLVTGQVKVVVEPAPTLSILNELHRGERAGSMWQMFIDAIAVLLVVLSVMGYLLFLSLRFRLRTALLITVGSVVAVWSVFAAAVA